MTLSNVPTLGLDEARELGALIGASLDANDAAALARRVEIAASALAVRFTYTLDDDKALAAHARPYAEDPARALAREAIDEDDHWFRSALVDAVLGRGIDPQSWQGTAAIGDLAKEIADAPLPRADQSFRIGESELFQRVILAARAVSPSHSLALPSNANRDVDTELKLFGERFVETACDLARIIIPPEDAAAHARLDGLKGRREILDGLRHARTLQSR